MLMAELGILNLFLALLSVLVPGLAFTELLLEEIGLNLARDLLTVHQPSLSTTLPCRVLLITSFTINLKIQTGLNFEAQERDLTCRD